MDSAPPGLSLEAGVVLDRYELLCTIARGGMAHVWLGRFKGKHGFEKLVAIKTILPEHALDDRFRRMFLDEARIASGIEHPNVAKILDLGESRDCLYLVMEYVDGDSLSRLRRTVEKREIKIPAPIALRLLADVCAGLHAAHELHGEDGASLGVVHRDVSPQNVLVPVNGVVKVIDFGVAKAAHRLGEETSAGFAKGKTRYMSPEQALSKPVDRRADIYALGAMAYELFEGVGPYEGANDMARLHALITGADVPVMQRAPSPAVAKAIMKALEREPDARFATAADFRAALEDAMVTLKVRATADDVSAFVGEHTKERIAERKRVVKMAVDSAGERSRIKADLEKGTVSGRPADASTPDLSPPDQPAPRPQSASPPPAAYSASLHEEPDAALPKRSKSWIIVAGAVGLAALLLVVAFALRSRNVDVASKASPTMTSSFTPDTPPTTSSIPPAPTPIMSVTMTPDDGVVDAGRSIEKIKHHVVVPTSTVKHPKPHDVVIQ